MWYYILECGHTYESDREETIGSLVECEFKSLDKEAEYDDMPKRVVKEFENSDY